jgi:hypothetical protein
MPRIKDIINEALEIAFDKLEVEALVRYNIMLLVLKKTKNKQYYSKVINDINPEELRLKRKLAMMKAHELKVNLDRFSEFELGVMHIVCDINAMTVKDFTINSRKRELTEARFHFAAVLLIHFNYTYKKVGTLLGRDHSTIIHSMKQHLNFSSSIKSYKTRYNQIINKMEETYPGLMSTTLNPNIIVRRTPLKRSKLINKDAKTN